MSNNTENDFLIIVFENLTFTSSTWLDFTPSDLSASPKTSLLTDPWRISVPDNKPLESKSSNNI